MPFTFLWLFLFLPYSPIQFFRFYSCQEILTTTQNVRPSDAVSDFEVSLSPIDFELKETEFMYYEEPVEDGMLFESALPRDNSIQSFEFFPNEVDRNPEMSTEGELTPSLQLKLFTSRSLQGHFINFENPIFKNTEFNPSVDTKIVVPSQWHKPVKGDGYDVMKNIMLAYGQYNVILFDWSNAHTGNVSYDEMVQNAKITGMLLSRFLNKMQVMTGISTMSIHVIGVHLGAHIAGFAGANVANLGRITGLDPSGPQFEGADPADRLDPTDALFVDVIHSNGGDNTTETLGLLEPLGHLDFYPNGGFQQPGCKPIDNESLHGINKQDWEIFSKNSCDHNRAMVYFVSSISRPGCCFFGISCAEWSDYLDGHCKDRWTNRIEMGFYPPSEELLHKNSRPKKIYLKTKNELPFCNMRQWVSYKILNGNVKCVTDDTVEFNEN